MSDVDTICETIRSRKENKIKMGCKVDEYRFVLNTLCKITPCNMLVFGLGNDSEIWMDVNKLGTTYFIEDNRIWIRRNKHIVNDHVKIVKTEYTTKRTQYLDSDLMTPNQLMLNLPDELSKVDWNLIFVDGPKGDKRHHPGRMQSLYTASVFAKRSPSTTHVFVHDINRVVESVYSRRYLGSKNVVDTHLNMRHFTISG